MHIDPRSMNQLKRKFNKLPMVTEKVVYKAMIGIGMDLTNQAKLLIKGLHVITSRLMNSIFLKTKGKSPMDANYSFDGGSGNRDFNAVLTDNEVAYGTNVEYADHIERLDSYMQASTNIFQRSSAHHLAKAAKEIEKEAAK